MTKLQCLIVEDEPLAAEVLTDYISQVTFLSVTSWCTDAMKALEVLRSQAIDVMFLDLHLPGIKGFELLKTLNHRPQVIITTAYHEYALRGYEWQVIDYLLKPIEFSRFLSAVNKLSVKNDFQKTGFSEESSSKPYLFFYADKKQVKVWLEEILFVESQKDYLKIVTRNKTIITRQTLQELEQQLPSEFTRVHRSYIVCTKAIDSFSSSEMEVANTKIPIGRNYRDTVLKKLRRE
jgi:DNA-binding LytR/AlgR family response regulator